MTPKQEIIASILQFIKAYCILEHADYKELDEFVDNLATNNQEIALISEELKETTHNLVKILKQI